MLSLIYQILFQFLYSIVIIRAKHAKELEKIIVCKSTNILLKYLMQILNEFLFNFVIIIVFKILLPKHMVDKNWRL